MRRIALLTEKKLVTVLREQIFSNHSGSCYFSLGDDQPEAAHPVWTKQNQLIEREIRKRVMRLKLGDVLWNATYNDLPRYFWD